MLTRHPYFTTLLIAPIVWREPSGVTQVGGGNVLWRGFARIVAIKPLTLFFMHLATWVDRPLLRMTNGRLRLSFIVPTLLLRCRGARSGKLREVPLLYVPDDDAVLLIGSNGGKTKQPAWCHNLRAEVERVEVERAEVSCALKGRVQRFRVVELSGSARERAWRDAVALYPGYERYEVRAGRQIPLFRLVPVETDK